MAYRQPVDRKRSSPRMRATISLATGLSPVIVYLALVDGLGTILTNNLGCGLSNVLADRLAHDLTFGVNGNRLADTVTIQGSQRGHAVSPDVGNEQPIWKGAAAHHLIGSVDRVCGYGDFLQACWCSGFSPFLWDPGLPPRLIGQGLVPVS
jgi:hypothetical protein